MFNVNQLMYMETLQALQDPRLIDVEGQEKVVQWLDSVYYRRLDDASIETIAGIILQEYPQLSDTRTRRYQFNTDKKTELLKIVFNRAFKRASDQGRTAELITQAEAASSTRIAYSKWSKIVQIKLPKMVGNMMGNQPFVLVVSQIGYWISACAFFVGYFTASSLANRVIIPFVLKHAPVQVIKAYPLASVIYRVYCVCLLVVMGCYFVQLAARRWNIASVNRVLSGVDFIRLLQRLPKPMHATSYYIIWAFKSIQFMMIACSKISIYLTEFSANTERNQARQVRLKAREVWINMMKNRPEVVAA